MFEAGYAAVEERSLLRRSRTAAEQQQQLRLSPQKVPEPAWARCQSKENTGTLDMPCYLSDGNSSEPHRLKCSSDAIMELPPSCAGSDGALTGASSVESSGSTRFSDSATTEVGSESEEEDGPVAGACTTIMVLNLPNHVSMKTFVDTLRGCSGLEGSYNFCNIPRSLQTGRNLGFAFVNFHTAAQAELFSQEWSGKEIFGKGKKLKTKQAKIQGLQANLLLAEKSMGRKSTSFKPLLSL